MTKSEASSYANSAVFVIGTAVVITSVVKSHIATREMSKQIRKTVKTHKRFDREFKKIVRNY